MLRALPVLLALVLVAFFFWSISGSDQGQPPLGAAEHPASERGAAVLGLPAPESSGRRLPGSKVESPQTDPGNAKSADGDEAPVVKYGQVSGFVFDEDGELMASQLIAFVPPEGLSDLVMSAQYKTYSDRQGAYHRKDFPVGSYVVLFYGNSKSPRIVGRLEVREGQNLYDVALMGQRTLGGQFSLKMPQGAVPPGASVELRLELRMAGSADVVALGTARTSTPQDASEKLPAQGAFSIGGLAPGSYTLRISFGADHVAFFERQIDLRDGDLVLPPEEFRMQDFVDEAYRRSKL